MKLQNLRRNAANTLVVVLILTSIMGFTLASYLILVRQQNSSIMRSVSWNSCIPVGEAGIEEAMVHINRSGLANLASCGWELTNGVYAKSRTLGDGYFVTTISATDPPVVVSEGFMLVPGSTSGAFAWLAQIGADCESAADYTRRRVRVTTRRQGVWMGAMVAKGKIDLKGNNIETDSFNPDDPTRSTGGLYDVNKRNDKGDVATNLTIENSINVGNADIYGHAATGPEGTIAIGPSGKVGSVAWNATHTGIEPGWSSDDMNFHFPDVVKPFSSGFSPEVNGKIGGTTFDFLLDGGAFGKDFSMNDLYVKNNQVMLITNDVRLLVTGNITIKGTLRIAENSSLVLYMEGASTDVSGSGIVNDSRSALNFFYYGLPSHTSIYFAGNGEFAGAIYAPNANFTMGGGGNSALDFIGASVTQTVTMNGHFKFHYDERLADSGLARGYIVDSWNEL